MGNSFYYLSPNNGQQSFAEVDFKRMYGQPGAGFYRWLIGLSLVVHNSERADSANLVLSDLVGDLYMTGPSNGELLIGRFFLSENRHQYLARWRGNTEQFNIEAELDARRLAAIEELRQGKDLNLMLKLSAAVVDTVTHARYGCDRITDIRFQATQSDWSKVLEGMHYHKTMLLEVPVPEESKDPVLAKAGTHLSNATGHMSRGHYRDAVGECRDVLDLMSERLGDPGDVPEEVKQWLKRDDSRTKQQRMARVNAILIQLTHLARHKGETDWLPEDAQSVILMTGALLRMAAENYGKAV